MLVRDQVISDSLHKLRMRKMRELFGFGWGAYCKPDKLSVDLSGVINYHPGRGLGLGQ